MSRTIKNCEYDDCVPIICYNCLQQCCRKYILIYNKVFSVCSIKCMYTFKIDLQLQYNAFFGSYIQNYIYHTDEVINDQNNKLCEYSHINRKWKNFASVYMKKWLINDLVKIILEY